MDQDVKNVLYAIPKDVDYTEFSDELDSEDISQERIEKVKVLLDSSDEYVAFEAARILTSWGQDIGFNKLANLIDTSKIDGYFTHRLHGYDETLEHVLGAFISYWTKNFDKNEQEARKKIFPYVSRIIKLSDTQPFDIRSLFCFVEMYHFDEYIPFLKEHLISIIDHPEIHGWKIHDAIKLFLKIEPDFVYKLLDEKGKTLKDFNFEE